MSKVNNEPGSLALRSHPTMIPRIFMVITFSKPVIVCVCRW